MAWSVDDLSLVTDILIGELTDAIHASTIWINSNFAFEVSGAMPEVSRTDGTNVLTLYLLHVGRDPYWRNTPVSGSRAQGNVSQPLSLNLSYLLTSYADANWMLEQQLMSIALSRFHAEPIFTNSAMEFTVTVEADSIEEMSRLWQAITAPIRLSAMFRVAVIFLAPLQPPVGDSRTPDVVNVSVAPDLGSLPTAAGSAVEPQLYSLSAQMTYAVPPDVGSDASLAAALAEVSVTSLNAVAIAGGSVRVRGTGLDVADAAGIFLSQGGTEWPVTAWRVTTDAASGVVSSEDELEFLLPVNYGAVPAAGLALGSTPLPGMYQLTVGNPGSAHRSNTVALAIGPRVDGIGIGTPVLVPDATQTYTLHASGLVAGHTGLELDSVPLTIGAATGAGVAVVDAVAGTIAWMLPAPTGFASGEYVRVRVLVNGVEAPPGWWVQMP
jgi:Pvc16 N-terminal domain